MELQTDSDIYAIIKMMPVFGRHSNLVLGYIELFGVTPMRGKTKKIRILLEEMKNLFDVQAFSYQKKKYQISQAGIAEALNVVVHRHFDTPLESHNYLKKIMIGIAEREDKDAGRTAERVLRKKEDRQRYALPEEGHNPPSIPPLEKGDTGGFDEKKNPTDHLTPEQIAENKLRLQGLLKSIG